MVTNAQFPDQLRDLHPVTQLYLSIDAATKDSLKAVDRPLFTDFWERFLSSIDELKKKGQRTVFRYVFHFHSRSSLCFPLLVPRSTSSSTRS